MFQPVGRQRAAVYWRRRLVLLAVVLLVVIIGYVELRPGGSDSAAKAPASTSSTRSVPTRSTASGSQGPQDSEPAGTSSSGVPSTAGTAGTAPATAGTTPHAASRPTTIATCTPAELHVAAAAGAASYAVGSQPVLSLVVSNIAGTSCVQDLADSQVELQVYNGESRVWGSHDCEIQPGVDKRTLKPGVTVRVGITWSGLSSQPKCAGTRERVGAGTYTIYAWLSGHEGSAAQFAMT